MPNPPATTPALRWILAVLAFVQIAIAVPALILGNDAGLPVHTARHLGSFDVALAVGFRSRVRSRSRSARRPRSRTRTVSRPGCCRTRAAAPRSARCTRSTARRCSRAGAAGAYGLTGSPYLALVDAQGKVVARSEGEVSDDVLVVAVKALVAGKPVTLAAGASSSK